MNGMQEIYLIIKNQDQLGRESWKKAN